MKKKMLLVTLFLFCLTLMCNKYVNADASLVRNSSSVTKGKQFKISISVSSVASATIKLSYDSSKVEFVSASGGTYNNVGNTVLISWSSGVNTNGIVAFVTFKAIDNGNASFSLNGQYIDEKGNDVGGSGYTSINIVDATTTPVKTTTNTKSNNANLKVLSLDKGTITPVFSADTMEYKVNVDDTINEVDVTATPDDSKATVNISGNKDLKVGENTISIDVTAEDKKTKKTYKIIVNKQVPPEKAYLSSLTFDNGTLSQEFKEDAFLYVLNDVSEDAISLKITAVPKYDTSKVEIIGADSLNDNVTVVKVKVTTKDGSLTKIYTIFVSKAGQTEISSLKAVDKISGKIYSFCSNQKRLVAILYIFAIFEFAQVVYLYNKVNKLEGKGSIFTVTTNKRKDKVDKSKIDIKLDDKKNDEVIKKDEPKVEKSDNLGRRRGAKEEKKPKNKYDDWF